MIWQDYCGIPIMGGAGTRPWFPALPLTISFLILFDVVNDWMPKVPAATHEKLLFAEVVLPMALLFTMRSVVQLVLLRVILLSKPVVVQLVFPLV